MLSESSVKEQKLGSFSESSTQKDLFRVAQSLGDMGLTMDMVKGIQTQIISSVRELHTDEYIALHELYSPDFRAFSPGAEGDIRSFSNALLSELSQGEDIRSLSEAEKRQQILELLDRGNVTLYWPYADEWDGKTLPTLVVSPEDDSQELCKGYELIKKGTGYALGRMVWVDEAYAMVKPVWVLNREARKREERLNEKLENTDKLRAVVLGSKITTLYLGSLQPTRHHDAWHKGGDEYEINVTAPKHILVGDSIKILDRQLAMFRDEFTRKAIRRRERREYQERVKLVSAWQPELDEIAMNIYENDASLFNRNDHTFSLSATWKGVKFTVEAKLPFASGDDELYKALWSAKYIFSDGNYNVSLGKFIQHEANGLLYTLPYKVHTIVHDPLEGWVD